MSKDKVSETKLQKILKGVNGERLTVNSKIKSGPGWSFTGNIGAGERPWRGEGEGKAQEVVFCPTLCDRPRAPGVANDFRRVVSGNISNQDQSPSIHGSRFSDFLRLPFTVYRSRLSIYDQRFLPCA